MREIDWDSITIADDVMFGTVFSDPGLCRRLLQMLLSMPIEHVEMVHREWAIEPEPGARGIRMDVYARGAEGRMFNVEMQKVEKDNLIKRSRYYLSANDVDCIKPGQEFEELRESFVIFVCLFDPFGSGLPRYTVTPRCRETGEEVTDGATRIFVNSRGYNSCDDPGLAAFLRYLSSGRIGNDEFCRDVEAEVRRYRGQPGWRVMRMRLEAYVWEKQREAEERGERIGMERGERIGMERGERIGMERGMERGLELGLRRVAALGAAMRDAGRGDELADALADGAAIERLCEEFGIGREPAAAEAPSLP